MNELSKLNNWKYSASDIETLDEEDHQKRKDGFVKNRAHLFP